MFKSALTGLAAIGLAGTLAGFPVAGQAAELSSISWDAIVAQARQEGEVNWFVWYYQDDFRKFVKPFEEEYGIKVIIPEGGSAEGNSAKLIADKVRQTGDIDVFTWGFQDFDIIPKQDFLTKLTMLPDYDDRVGTVAGIDGEGYVLGYVGNQTGIAYDPAKIAEKDLPQTVDDFARFWREHPGKFGFNYSKGGSGPAFYEGVLQAITGFDVKDGTVSEERLAALQPGFDFFNRYAQDYVITASTSDSLVRLSDGELWLTPAWESQLAKGQGKGELRADLKLYIPEMGMAGGGNGVAIPRNAPHPAAAALFIAWLTSADVQTEYNKVFTSVPMNRKAKDLYGLVPSEQRVRQTAWAAKPFKQKMEEAFINAVILAR